MSGKTVFYARVSSLEQRADRQVTGISVDKVFEDKCSGKDTNRPQLQACLEYLRDGDTLVVHSIDRLARSLRDLLNIVQELLARKVSIRFIKEGMDFNGDNPNPTQDLYLNILGAVAEFERALIRERQAEGIALARQRNAYDKCGRKPSLTPKQIEDIKGRLALGEPLAPIAKEYGVSRQTIYVNCKGFKRD
jgi:DNA invertase Pin-like site-specific DNA recombinase